MKGREGAAEAKVQSTPCAAVTRGQRKEADKHPGHKEVWLEGWDNVEMRNSQLRDSEIGLIMTALDQGTGRPDWSDVSGESQALKMLWGQWDRLLLKDGVLYRRWEDKSGIAVSFQLVVPQEKRKEVLHHLHSAPGSGHMGVHRTVERVRQHFFWVGIKVDVRHYCRECDACTAFKLPKGGPKAPMKVHLTGEPMGRMGIDIQGPLPKTKNGNTVILVMQDYFTKWCEAVALPNQEATTVAKALAEHWVCKWGAPVRLHSDQGRTFESAVFAQLMELFGIKKTRTMALHPASNGLVERLNSTIAKILAVSVDKHPETWDEHLPYATMSYNSSKHATTKFTRTRTSMMLDLYKDQHDAGAAVR